MQDEEAEAFIEVPFTVEPNYAGWRLDRYLCVKIRRLSRARVQRLIDSSLISARPLKASTLIQPGLHFRIRRRVSAEPETPDSVQELFRDEALLVLDKPAGLPIHPTARYYHNTLVSLLKRLHGADFRADPAHRLDRETSGVIVCGRTLLSCQRLMRSFMDGDVEKTYWGICEGWPDAEFQVDAPIAEGTPEIRVAVRIDAAVGKPACTDFKVLQRFEKDGERFAWIEARPQTGRQHQIRIHLNHAGFPLVGDKMYGPDPGYFDRFSKGCLEPEGWERLRLPRHALHAAQIVFPHPLTGERVTFRAPMPEDLRSFIDEPTLPSVL
jgi:23S rRNA pseudouridine1911/1915/1917 synthase